MTVFWSRWVSLEVKYLFPIKFMKLKIVISAPTWLNCACAAHVSHNGNGPVFLLADFSTWGDADPHCHPPCRPAALKGAIQSVAPRWIRACWCHLLRVLGTCMCACTRHDKTLHSLVAKSLPWLNGLLMVLCFDLSRSLWIPDYCGFIEVHRGNKRACTCAPKRLLCVGGSMSFPRKTGKPCLRPQSFFWGTAAAGHGQQGRGMIRNDSEWF